MDTEKLELPFSDIAPKLADLTRDVLFGDIWERAALSPRDRSLITLAALVALHRPDQIEFHIVKALENGVTGEELAELVTHLAFYAGWPASMTAIKRVQQALVEYPSFNPAPPAFDKRKDTA